MARQRRASDARTARDIQSYALDSKGARGVREFAISKYPTPMRKVKSIGALRKKIEHFFDPNYVPDAKEWKQRTTLNDLALFLGYASQQSMLGALYQGDEYSKWIEYAIGRLLGIFDEQWLGYMSDSKDPAKAMEGFVMAMERRIDKANPNKDSKGQIDININISKEKQYEAELDESISMMTEVYADVEEITDSNDNEEALMMLEAPEETEEDDG